MNQPDTGKTTITLQKLPMRAPEQHAPERQFEIEVSLANDGEPRDIFVGADGRDFLIRRGEKVVVPERVLSVLKDAVKGVSEVDPQDDTKSVTVMRQRYSYTVHRQL